MATIVKMSYPRNAATGKLALELTVHRNGKLTVGVFCPAESKITCNGASLGTADGYTAKYIETLFAALTGALPNEWEVYVTKARSRN